MSAAKSTSGPWSIQFGRPEIPGVNVTFSIDSASRINLCGGQSQEHINGILEEECIANARLIAAAPDLLSVAMRLLDVAEHVLQCEGHYVSQEDIDAARAAIAKATTGGAS